MEYNELTAWERSNPEAGIEREAAQDLAEAHAGMPVCLHLRYIHSDIAMHKQVSLMLTPPPFKLASELLPFSATISADVRLTRPCCEDHADGDSIASDLVDSPTTARRQRLGDMEQYLHCSVLGTCLSTSELRRLMSRFVNVEGISDVDVHHDAVWLAGENGPVTKALHKALDQRHAVAVKRFASALDEKALTALWSDALASGEIPGAYWAVLTHRALSADLRKKVFGDVHMLSHLVGAANRADIRRLVLIERENAELRGKMEKQQQRSLELVAEQDAALDQIHCLKAMAPGSGGHETAPGLPSDSPAPGLHSSDLVALQTHRREVAEAAAAMQAREAERLQSELDYLRHQADQLARELASAEQQLCQTGTGAEAVGPHLKGQRILYVGGRPSSASAIRDLVERHGGEIRRHDGGLEDRKGMLAAGVSWSTLVLFPVDCVDHDSALNLKRLCHRLGVPFVPLRTASVTSFVWSVTSSTHATRVTESTASGSGDDLVSSPSTGCHEHPQDL